MLDIKYRFTCRDSDLSKIIKKCQNIMTRIVWKVSFTLHLSIDNSTFWKLCKFWLKNVRSLRKQVISRVQSFLKSNFDLNQGQKKKNSANTRPLTSALMTEVALSIFTSWLKKCFEVTKQVWRRLGEVRAKILFPQTILAYKFATN